MKQQQKEGTHRILGRTVGRGISAEEAAAVAGAASSGGNVGTRPHRIGNEVVYLDMGPDPTL
ncbi:hypothetical protein ACFDR9_004869 [Janthinobacterium sp. CG_23.3]